MAGEYDYLGTNLSVPFRRDGKDDFAKASGIDAVESALTIVLGTLRAGPKNEGEIPFNQELGTLLPLIRHRNVDDSTTEELAVHYTLESIKDNAPRIKAKAMGFTKSAEDKTIRLRLQYDVVDRDTSGVKVIRRDLEKDFAV
jgi:hypothetical protein